MVVLRCSSRKYLPHMARDNEIMNSAVTQFRTFKFLHSLFNGQFCVIRTAPPLEATDTAKHQKIMNHFYLMTK
jgi:hypothetical protein